MNDRLAHRYGLLTALSVLLCGPFWGLPEAVAAEDGPRVVGLPFKRGYWAFSARGPKKGHGWIFNLSEGPPVVAAAPGRVFQVNEPMGIFVDHGDGRYGAYMINGRWKPEVEPGALIAAGTELADIDTRGNRKGRGAPLFNFSMRGPADNQTHDLLFRLAGSKKGVEIGRRTKYLSGTRQGIASGGNFRDSVLEGDEFRKNGITLSSRNPLFWLESGAEAIYEGKVLHKDVEFVVFHIWHQGEAGKKEVAYTTRAKPNPDGTFQLKAMIPNSLGGTCWYRLAVKRSQGPVAGPVSLRAGAAPDIDAF